MYFTRLPDHSRADFDEHLHFSRFKKQNMIFNARSSQAGCDNHVGCLSFKSVTQGEEWYGIDGRQIAVRPGQFLILNDDQPYSCRIHRGEPAKVLSVFFKKEFARDVIADMLSEETTSLEDPLNTRITQPLDFFQTLHPIDLALRSHLSSFISHLESAGYNSNAAVEYLIPLLRHCIRSQHAHLVRAAGVNALKKSTRDELYRRLCIAKDQMHTSFSQPLDLQTLSRQSCLSIPQLVRHFRAAFHTTPHRYLVTLRLQHAAHLLTDTSLSIATIMGQCGYEDPSAFSRAFRSAHGLQPEAWRRASTSPARSLAPRPSPDTTH